MTWRARPTDASQGTLRPGSCRLAACLHEARQLQRLAHEDVREQAHNPLLPYRLLQERMLRTHHTDNARRTTHTEHSLSVSVGWAEKQRSEKKHGQTASYVEQLGSRVAELGVGLEAAREEVTERLGVLLRILHTHTHTYIYISQHIRHIIVFRKQRYDVTYLYKNSFGGQDGTLRLGAPEMAVRISRLMGSSSRYGAEPSTISITRHPKLQISNCGRCACRAVQFSACRAVPCRAVPCGGGKTRTLVS